MPSTRSPQPVVVEKTHLWLLVCSLFSVVVWLRSLWYLIDAIERDYPKRLKKKKKEIFFLNSDSSQEVVRLRGIECGARSSNQNIQL